MNALQRAEWRKQFAALADRRMHALAANMAGAPRDVLRFFLEPQMEKLIDWRLRLNVPEPEVLHG